MTTTHSDAWFSLPKRGPVEAEEGRVRRGRQVADRGDQAIAPMLVVAEKGPGAVLTEDLEPAACQRPSKLTIMTGHRQRICEQVRSGSLGRRVDDFVDVLARVRDEHDPPACSSCRDLQRLAGSAARRRGRHRRDAGRLVSSAGAPATDPRRARAAGSRTWQPASVCWLHT